jgi:protein-S-isoprenylcysteine O-methyltransferase Ste14
MIKAELYKKVLTRILLALIIFPLIIFLPAWSLAYWPGWLFMGIIFIPFFFILAYFLRTNPEFLLHRMQYREKEPAQKTIIKYSLIPLLMGYLIPGFDYRFHWSNVPAEIIIVANFMVLISYLFIFRVFKENSYASRIVEIQKGQKVISTGPYALVRHPMYLGALILYIFAPLALGSYWGMLFTIGVPVILILRILNEEKVLSKGLPGYKEYCRKVRYRLIPFIW